MMTWSSSVAQPINGWQQGPHFASSPFSSGFLHGGTQRQRHPASYSEELRSSYQSTQTQETLQFQDELSELMMGKSDESESFGLDTTKIPYQWSGDTQWCDNLVSPSMNSVMTSCPEYGMSSWDSTAASPQETIEPASPEAHAWKTHQVKPHIRRDSVNDVTPNGLPATYSQYENPMSFQYSNNIQGCEDQKVKPSQESNWVGLSQFNTSSTLPLDVFRPTWLINPELDAHERVRNVSLPQETDPFFHRIRWLPEGARPQSSVRAEQDRLIIEGKRQNMSYKEIKEHYKIEGAVSTLRGRYRAAIKPKNQRVRKPEWKPKDVSRPSKAMILIQAADWHIV
jgi:hypothetical protein